MPRAKSGLDMKNVDLFTREYGYPDFNGKEWQSKKAVDKWTGEGSVWEALTDNNVSSPWPSAFSAAQLFVEDMDTTFDFAQDDMPRQYFNFSIRSKLIHSVGTVAKCTWKSVGDHPYTGLFKGADYGYIRHSAANKPDDTTLTPGIAVKFFRDGMDSANFVAMYALTGQTSFNFFAHDHTNHVPDIPANSPLPQRLLKQAFLKASDWPTFVGLSDFAQFDQEGNEEQEPRYPFRLIMHPVTKLHTMFPDTPGPGSDDWLKRLVSVPGNFDAYEIYAQDEAEPWDGYMNVTRIGTLHLASAPVTSYFGDVGLFIQHQRWEDDLNYRPDWAGPAKEIIAAQGAQDSSWTFPDLPWE